MPNLVQGDVLTVRERAAVQLTYFAPLRDVMGFWSCFTKRK